MKKIKLTQNKFALIDNEDYRLISKYKWCAVNNHNYTYYALSGCWNKQTKKVKQIRMHRLIMGITDPKIQIDHINGNGLDNRKKNLRVCNNSQNHMNQEKRKFCSSRFKGVYWYKLLNKWRARIYMNGKSKDLGHFDNEIEAAKVYNEAAIRYFGEFAKLNVIKRS